MNPFSIFLVNNEFLGSFLLVIMILICSAIFGFTVYKICDHFKMDQYNNGYLSIRSSFFFIIASMLWCSASDIIRGKATLTEGIRATVMPDNKYRISYQEKIQERNGRDLDGKEVFIVRNKMIEKDIVCQVQSKTIEYRECWNMLKSKNPEELIAMAQDITPSDSRIGMAK